MRSLRSELKWSQKILVLSLVSLQAQAALADDKKTCTEALSRTSAPVAVSPRTTQQAWAESVEALRQIGQRVYGRDQVIEALATAILAREFVWINGDPGGAKTYLSRLMFQSVLNTIPEKDKKIFLIQFHKLVAEGKIIGFQKFSAMMKEGKYEIETESSLVGDRFLFLIADEAEKANPTVLNALLGVLNERKAFHGGRVVDAALASGVFTANKTIGEFVESFLDDRPSGEALLDRKAIKLHMQNQQLTPRETVAMYHLVKNSNKGEITLPLHELEALIAKVKIPDDMLAEISSIVREIDRYVTGKADESRKAVRYRQAESEYFPANQLSNRSVRRLLPLFKAALIARQLMDGVPYEQMRLTPNRRDLILLAQSVLYVAPAGIRFKTYPLAEAKGGLKITSPYGSTSEMAVQYSPYEDKLLLQDGNGKTHFVYIRKDNGWVLRSQSPDFAEWSVNPAGFVALEAKINAVITTNQIDFSKPQFEVDKGIDLLIATGTVEEPTRLELTSIKKDLEKFADILTRHFEKTQVFAPRPSQEKLLPARSVREQRLFRREMRAASAEDRVAMAYEWMLYEVKAIRQRFVEMNHAIEAHLTGLLAGNHLYVFGPPGGAKTALAEVIFKAELKKLNADQVDAFVASTLKVIGKDQNFLRALLRRLRTEKPQVFDRFFLQFHKLVPEGVLSGFPKVEKQLNEGIEEIEVTSSLANQKFIFAILDEVDKANPQTLTALLSILNEREVFVGGQVLKTALRTAISTSNTMPSEVLKSYGKDRNSGKATMDRIVNKLFVSNKISSEEGLTWFLIQLEKGVSPSWNGWFAIGELAPLVSRVEYENPVLEELMATVRQKFLARRMVVAETTLKKHRTDKREFPYYYVAASTASDRTVMAVFDQFKARFIVHQLMQGVPFEDLRTTIELKDINLFFEGLGYWAPQSIEPTYKEDGLLKFTNNSDVLKRLISSGIVDARVKFQLEMMVGEAEDYAAVLNEVIIEFMRGYRDEITKYPDLFPSLFVNERARAQVLSAPGTGK